MFYVYFRWRSRRHDVARVQAIYNFNREKSNTGREKFRLQISFKITPRGMLSLSFIFTCSKMVPRAAALSWKKGRKKKNRNVTSGVLSLTTGTLVLIYFLLVKNGMKIGLKVRMSEYTIISIMVSALVIILES